MIIIGILQFVSFLRIIRYMGGIPGSVAARALSGGSEFPYSAIAYQSDFLTGGGQGRGALPSAGGSVAFGVVF